MLLMYINRHAIRQHATSTRLLAYWLTRPEQHIQINQTQILFTRGSLVICSDTKRRSSLVWFPS